MKDKIEKKDLPKNVERLLKDIYESVGVNLHTKSKSKLPGFDELLHPLKDAYEQIIIKKNRKFVWNGKKEFSTNNLQSTNPSISQMFNHQTMKEYQEQTNRDFVEQIMIVAIQIGIDHGIQLEREEANNQISEIIISGQEIEKKLNSRSTDQDKVESIKFHFKGIILSLKQYLNRIK